MALPTVTIITPSFNQARWLRECVRSVQEQSAPPLEHLVMDGGSTDGSVAVLEELQARFGARLQFKSGPDGGQAAAINAGISRTRGEIVGWLNSDDLYLPGALDAVARAFAEHPEADWLYGRCPMIDGEGRPMRSLITRYKEFWARRYSYSRLLIENFISQPAVFFRRSAWERHGPLDPALHFTMDYQLWLKLGAASPPLFLERELACFRVSGENKTSLGFRKSFAEELEVARRTAAGRHPILLARHAVNRWKLVAAYEAMRLLRR